MLCTHLAPEVPNSSQLLSVDFFYRLGHLGWGGSREVPGSIKLGVWSNYKYRVGTNFIIFTVESSERDSFLSGVV